MEAQSGDNDDVDISAETVFFRLEEEKTKRDNDNNDASIQFAWKQLKESFASI